MFPQTLALVTLLSLNLYTSDKLEVIRDIHFSFSSLSEVFDAGGVVSLDIFN